MPPTSMTWRQEDKAPFDGLHYYLHVLEAPRVCADRKYCTPPGVHLQRPVARVSHCTTWTRPAPYTWVPRFWGPCCAGSCLSGMVSGGDPGLRFVLDIFYTTIVM